MKKYQMHRIVYFPFPPLISYPLLVDPKLVYQPLKILMKIIFLKLKTKKAVKRKCTNTYQTMFVIKDS